MLGVRDYSFLFYGDWFDIFFVIVIFVIKILFLVVKKLGDVGILIRKMFKYFGKNDGYFYGLRLYLFVLEIVILINFDLLLVLVIIILFGCCREKEYLKDEFFVFVNWLMDEFLLLLMFVKFVR